jgi:hypothetical protein
MKDLLLSKLWSSIKHNPSQKIHALLEQSGEKLKMTILPSEPIMMNA